MPLALGAHLLGKWGLSSAAFIISYLSSIQSYYCNSLVTVKPANTAPFIPWA